MIREYIEEEWQEADDEELLPATSIFPWCGTPYSSVSELEAPNLYTWSLSNMTPNIYLLGMTTDKKHQIIAWPYTYFCNDCNQAFLVFIPTIMSSDLHAKLGPSILKCFICDGDLAEVSDIISDRQ